MDKKIIIFSILILINLFYLPLFAETIVLKSGKQIKARIIERTDEYIKVDFRGVPITYYFDEVKSISGQPSVHNNDKDKSVIVEVLNPEYTKPPNENSNVEITDESTLEDILKKIEYYYANHNFDKAIALCETVLKNTDDRQIKALINYDLSANYLEKGIEPYLKNKDDSFYRLSIEYAKKTLEVFPEHWQALANIGAVHLNMGNYKQAIYYYSEAKKYLDSTDPNYTSMERHINIAKEMIKRQ